MDLITNFKVTVIDYGAVKTKQETRNPKLNIKRRRKNTELGAMPPLLTIKLLDYKQQIEKINCVYLQAIEIDWKYVLLV